MSRAYLFLLLVTLIGSGSYFYYAHTPLCLVPMTYRLGTVDVRFNLTDAAARAYLDQATGIWEKSSGKNLFVYDASSSFPVNFIFDDRQERTIAEQAERTSLDAQESTSAEIAAKYKSLTAEYATLKSSFAADTATYEAKLAAFNAKVANYNKNGGAPETEFAKLKIEERKLSTTADALQVRTANMVKLAAQINDLSEQGNRLIEQYNAGVEDYNHNFATANEFTQGDYQGTNINIYKFSSDNELLRVLTHEFGHSLGLGHVEGSSSIMYYLMEKQPDAPVLTPEDTAAFATVCNSRTALVNRFYRPLHSLISVLITKF